MIDAPPSPYLVPFDESFRIADAGTQPSINDREENKHRLKAAVRDGDNHLIERKMQGKGDQRNGTEEVYVIFAFHPLNSAEQRGQVNA